MRAGAKSARQTAREAAEDLRRAGVPEPEASAEVLLSELLCMGRSDLASYNRPLTPEQETRFVSWISRRKEREPVQRIVGRAYFRNLGLDLNPATLIPRPDTESVVDVALERIDVRGGACLVLDLGTGSGAIAISIALERPRCEVHATDVSGDALATARRNAGAAGVSVAWNEADVARGLQALAGRVDLLVSNPPYVKSGDLGGLAPEVRVWDPRSALDGGPDGMEFYRRIFAETPSLLVPGADVVLEVGDGQADVVVDLGARAGFSPVDTREDLAGSVRVALLRWPG